jgi:hypothetical protein
LNELTDGNIRMLREIVQKFGIRFQNRRGRSFTQVHKNMPKKKPATAQLPCTQVASATSMRVHVHEIAPENRSHAFWVADLSFSRIAIGYLC